MLPSVLGFNSVARATATVMFQSCRFRRFCHIETFSAVKLPARSARSCGVGGGTDTSCADEAIVKEKRSPKRERERETKEQRPVMYPIIPNSARRCIFHHATEYYRPA